MKEDRRSEALRRFPKLGSAKAASLRAEGTARLTRGRQPGKRSSRKPRPPEPRRQRRSSKIKAQTGTTLAWPQREANREQPAGSAHRRRSLSGPAASAPSSRGHTVARFTLFPSGPGGAPRRQRRARLSSLQRRGACKQKPGRASRRPALVASFRRETRGTESATH